MKTTQAQNSTKQRLTERLADQTWALLEDLFDLGPKKRPPIYFFMSPQSKNSLRGRSLFEIELVHRQQYLGEGLTLKLPPQAYVSKIDQSIEETAHLFALSYQNSTKKFLSTRRRVLSPKKELWHMCLHEVFGRFTHHIVEGKLAPFKGSRLRQDLWEMAHREGYYLAGELSRAYFEERIGIKELRSWFKMNWFSPLALKRLYKLLKKSPPSTDFLKLR